MIAACATTQRVRVERADQLPVHRYPVSGEVGRLVTDDAAFADLARALRTDLEDDLARYDIREPASLKDRLFILALLDALDGKWKESLARIDQIAALEVELADKVMTGLTIRVWADAVAHGGDPGSFRAALERRLNTTPTALVRDQLAMLRTMSQVFTPAVCRQLVDEKIAPNVQGGALSLEQAHAIAFQRYAVVRLVPVGKAIDEVLGTHGIEAQK